MIEQKKRLERCKNCPYCRHEMEHICTVPPYKGTWVQLIKKCPLMEGKHE